MALHLPSRLLSLSNARANLPLQFMLFFGQFVWLSRLNVEKLRSRSGSRGADLLRNATSAIPMTPSRDIDLVLSMMTGVLPPEFGHACFQ